MNGLKDFKDTIEKVFIDYEIKYKEQPTPAALRDLVKAALHKRQPNKQTFLSYFEDFVNRSLAGDRIDPRSKKPVRHGVAKGYKTTLAHLKAFSETWARELTFANIDLEFHADYIRYLKTEGKSKDGSPLHLSANTIGSHIQRIKAVMSEATERGINSNLAFKSRYFIKQTEDADTIYLDEKEIKEMLNLDLSENDRLQNARDLFLIGCYTGLRFSDFSRLTLENIKGDYIKIVQLKTGAPVTIPIHKVVRGIIEKHNGFPRPISDIKLNAYLKEIGQLMQTMSKVESKTITKGGSVITKMSPKWQFLTTHAARRSFATNEYLAGTPILTLMAVTGHKSIKSFLKYIRVTQDEQAVGMKAGWDDREKLKAV